LFNDISKKSALRALGGDVKKNVHFQRGKIRSHGRKHFSIYKHFPRCAQLGAMLRYLERNFSGAIVMRRSIFEEKHHVRTDISNEISGGDLDAKIDFQSVMFFKLTIQNNYLLGLKD